MKKLLLVLFLSSLSMAILAQEKENGDDAEVKPHGFQKEKLFTGGGVDLAFYSGGATLGISPYLGYSVTKWFDAAVKFNVHYQSETDYYNNRYRQTNFGPGAFVRLFPVDFLFIQSQYEHNFITQKQLPQGGGVYKNKYDANSLLLGAGYCSGRGEGSRGYFYLSVLIDVLQQPNSPYVDNNGRIQPIISAGYNISLFQGAQQRDGGRQPRNHNYNN